MRGFIITEKNIQSTHLTAYKRTAQIYQQFTIILISLFHSDTSEIIE